jgi:hypothetical protein
MRVKPKIQWRPWEVGEPGTWNVCQEKPQAMTGTSLRERPCELQTARPLGQGCSKPLGPTSCHHVPQMSDM